MSFTQVNAMGILDAHPVPEIGLACVKPILLAHIPLGRGTEELICFDDNGRLADWPSRLTRH
jgi:hypothetical protein